MSFVQEIGCFLAMFSEVQSICHRFATRKFKIDIKSRKAAEHSEHFGGLNRLFLCLYCFFKYFDSSLLHNICIERICL